VNRKFRACSHKITNVDLHDYLNSIKNHFITLFEETLMPNTNLEAAALSPVVLSLYTHEYVVYYSVIVDTAL